MFGRGFLRAGGYLNSKVDRFGEHFPSFSVDDLDVLDINRSYAQVICLEDEYVLFAKDGFFDDLGGMVMEFFEDLGRHRTTHSGCY